MLDSVVQIDDSEGIIVKNPEYLQKLSVILSSTSRYIRNMQIVYVYTLSISKLFQII